MRTAKIYTWFDFMDGGRYAPCSVRRFDKEHFDHSREQELGLIITIPEGYRLSDISHAVQEYVESHGYSVVREYVGHGIGRRMHESPEVPNFGHPGHGPRLLRGMTIAVEPMVNAGSAAIRQMSDGWTVKTADGRNAAHYENTILITDGDPELLTDASASLV